jgi:predicted dehydrogenase
MGRRHLKGLVRAGFDVIASDPDPAAFGIAHQELAAAGLPIDRVRVAASGPSGRFDVAVFSETAPARLDNFRRFLAEARADRVLLEKPLSADPSALESFVSLARDHDLTGAVQVNLGRRAWPHIKTLAQLCASEGRFAVTVTAGAIGLGGTGIHLLDTFLFLAGEERPQVVWASLSDDVVRSGRGAQFRDYGGEFVLRGSRGTLLASLEAGSSANVVMTVRGAHFVALMDYTDMRWKLSRRRSGSALPNYRYGADYEVVEEGPLSIVAMDVLTEQWALGRVQLPPVDQACVVHRLLTDILLAAGARPPYSFT